MEKQPELSVRCASFSLLSEHNTTKNENGSTSTLCRYPRQPSADIKLFTPELVENDDQDEYRYFFPGPGQFLCEVTNIVFEMESEGEVKYRLISWNNRILDNLPQKEPAGPLYNIDGPEGSVRRLHFPHCEIGKGKEKLSVAHVTDGKVEIIHPQTVTETHVIINVQSLCPFGLTFPCNRKSIKAQVLLFYKKKTEHSKSKLNVHLLPANVPAEEVQKQHKSYTYIETTSSCKLTPGQKYRLHYTNTDNTDNTDKTDNTELQPEVVKFQQDSGPNYHPTFEILNIEVAEVTLNLLDKKGKEVWTRNVDLFTGTEPNTSSLDIAGADFVDEHRETLIQRFPLVMEFADCLIGKKMITKEMYENIQAKETPQDRMRELYKYLDSVGRAAKQEFYNILEKDYSCLVDDLKSAAFSLFSEQNRTKNAIGSTSPLCRYSRQPSRDISHQLKLFRPELVKNDDQDEYRYSFPGPGQFLCELTNIVFEMESEGEVKYRIISWNNWILDNLPQKEPAGPLYNIDGPEGSVRRLHFPHCETGKGKEKLTVSHVNDGKVEIIHPQTVTETHVIINVQSLSPFGLTSTLNKKSIRAQVLLFYRKKTEHSKSKLNVHLLPANVPVKEVQKQHKSYTYIETTSSCELTLRTKYRLHYTSTDNTDNTVLQPEVVKFHRDCGPNYHPTFEILNIEVAEVTLNLLDKKGKEVWTRNVDLFVGTEPDSHSLDTAGADFVDEHRETLIQRFPLVMEVADCLYSKNMITKKMYDNIQAKETPQDKMRELYTCLDSAGRAAKHEFYNILKNDHKCLFNDLKSGQV